MDRRHFPLILLVPILLSACASTVPIPEPQGVRVEVRDEADRTWLVRGKMERPLGALNTARVIRLAGVLFPDCIVDELRHGAYIEVSSPASATALVDGLRWIDGMILARRGLREKFGTPAASDAGLVAETIRAWLMVDPPGPHPDWSALSESLAHSGLWTESPRSAGLGAVLLAGILTRDRPSATARARAGALLAQVVVAEKMPGWLSWVAYRNWRAKDFLASDESQ